MKKLLTLLLISATFLLAGCGATTFATVGNNGWKVTLYHTEPDVKILENGKDCPIVQAYAGHKKAGYASGGGLISLYTNGILLDNTVATHTITITKGAKSATATFDKSSQPFLDVTAALGESKVMSFSDLQNEYVKNHKK